MPPYGPVLPDLLHVSRADVLALDIAPARMRAAMAEVFADLALGQCVALPKAQLPAGPEATFQAMVAASHRWGMAAVKWVGVVPVGPGSALPGVSATLCLNDLATGHPLALMDGEVITLLRTAAMSALAAGRLVARPPEVLALAGCGAQAQSHLAAFRDLYPSLRRVLCFSRSPASAERMAERARAMGLVAEVVAGPGPLLARADIIISTVPAGPDMQPMLDARAMKPDALAVMVDLGRSWIPSSLTGFALIATDSLDQMRHPLDASGQAVAAAPITQDLSGLAPLGPGRRAFCFRGHAAGDLAAAVLVHQMVRAQGGGQVLAR